MTAGLQMRLPLQFQHASGVFSWHLSLWSGIASISDTAALNFPQSSCISPPSRCVQHTKLFFLFFKKNISGGRQKGQSKLEKAFNKSLLQAKSSSQTQKTRFPLWVGWKVQSKLEKGPNESLLQICKVLFCIFGIYSSPKRTRPPQPNSGLEHLNI